MLPGTGGEGGAQGIPGCIYAEDAHVRVRSFGYKTKSIGDRTGARGREQSSDGESLSSAHRPRKEER